MKTITQYDPVSGISIIEEGDLSLVLLVKENRDGPLEIKLIRGSEEVGSIHCWQSGIDGGGYFLSGQIAIGHEAIGEFSTTVYQSYNTIPSYDIIPYVQGRKQDELKDTHPLDYLIEQLKLRKS